MKWSLLCQNDRTVYIFKNDLTPKEIIQTITDTGAMFFKIMSKLNTGNYTGKPPCKV